LSTASAPSSAPAQTLASAPSSIPSSTPASTAAEGSQSAGESSVWGFVAVMIVCVLCAIVGVIAYLFAQWTTTWKCARRSNPRRQDFRRFLEEENETDATDSKNATVPYENMNDLNSIVSYKNNNSVEEDYMNPLATTFTNSHRDKNYEEKDCMNAEIDMIKNSAYSSVADL